MMDPIRVSPSEARMLMINNEALLVATYEGESFERNYFTGAVPIDMFQEQLPALAKERELVFY